MTEQNKPKAIVAAGTVFRQQASKYLAKAADNKALLLFVAYNVAFEVSREKVAIEDLNRPTNTIPKAYFAHNSFVQLTDMLAKYDIVTVTNRNAFEFALRKVPFPAAYEVLPLAENIKTAYEKKLVQPVQVPDVITQACASLNSKYGFKITIGVGGGYVTIPPASRERWSFSCNPAHIRFPVAFVTKDDKLTFLSVGHYQLTSTEAEGFTVDSLEEALLHCFNLVF